jgi:hypothetical protein
MLTSIRNVDEWKHRGQGESLVPLYTRESVSLSLYLSLTNGSPWIEAAATEVQQFVRTTRKYWVATEDVSGVKQAIAQHLPVFLTGGRASNSFPECLLIGTSAPVHTRRVRFPDLATR